MEKCGRPDDAKTVRSFSASFAKWRWATLQRVLVDVLAIQPGLHFFSRDLSASTKDATNLSLVLEAIASQSFWLRCKLMLRFIDPMERCRVWGSGCPCHTADLLEGHQIVCVAKGRRLREVRNKVASFCVSFRRAAERLSLHADCEEDGD